MFDAFSLGVLLAIGQTGPDVLPPAPELPRQMILPSAPASAPAVIRVVPGGQSEAVVVPRLVQDVKAPVPAQLPKGDVKPVPAQAPKVEVKPAELPKGDVKPAPAAAAPAPAAPEAPAAAEEKKDETPAKGFFMAAIEGTPLGQQLECRKISISGWVTQSYNGSSANVSNLPTAWTDRANRYMLQQAWTTIKKDVDTDSKEINFGFRGDLLFGTDYRYTLARGVFNSQLLNAAGNQNFYGFDPIQFYASAFLPGIFEGTEVRVGRLYTPWGLESLEAPTTPLMSRSYAFNSAPPFTQTGIGFYSKISDNLSTVAMVAQGNDNFFTNADEYRFVGAATWTSCDKNDTVTVATSFGRGKFNTGSPFAPATVSLMSENAGRNNLNAFDITYTHKFNECLTYSLEAIYGYQTGVPSTAAVGAIPGARINNSLVSGNAEWGSLAQYVTYKFNDTTTGIVRYELFDDADGQRTGFNGLYSGLTAGVQFKPKDWLIFRPEVRWDHNNTSNPWEGRNNLFMVGADLTVKW